MMSEVSGIPTTTEGPCNVDWVVMAPNFIGVTEPTADETAVLLWIYMGLR
jgi:hypothetical protein